MGGIKIKVKVLFGGRGLNMELVIRLEREQSREKISFSGKTVKELLLKLKLNPETVLVVRNKEVLTEDELLKNKDEIEILSVVSGG